VASPIDPDEEQNWRGEKGRKVSILAEARGQKGDGGETRSNERRRGVTGRNQTRPRVYMLKRGGHFAKQRGRKKRKFSHLRGLSKEGTRKRKSEEGADITAEERKTPAEVW